MSGKGKLVKSKKPSTRRVWNAFRSYYLGQGWHPNYISKIYQYWKGSGYQNMHWGQQKPNDALRFMHLVPWKFRSNAFYLPAKFRTPHPKIWSGRDPRYNHAWMEVLQHNNNK